MTDNEGARQQPKQPCPPTSLPQTVRIDDEPVLLRDRYDLLLNKPLGVVTAHADARHPTAYALVCQAPLGRELRAVGRLDKETSGLLLWTTDGSLLHRVTHPRYAVPRSYEAALVRDYAEPPKGLTLDDGYQPEIVELTELEREATHPALNKPQDAVRFARITITSGRFHEVRRIFAALGSHVTGLCRVRFGPIELPTDLPLGDTRAIDMHAPFHGLSPRV